ncbi:hypothetical protein CRYUN_Cryun25bG0017100 [Craigia yunnanensis]
MADMGIVSTSQTAATPFGRPFCRSSSWFSRSCSRHFFLTSSRALHRREICTMQSVHCSFHNATLSSSSRHCHHPKDMRLKVAAFEYARMVHPDRDQYLSDNKSKGVSVDQRNNESPASYGKSRVTSFQANAFMFTPKSTSIPSAECSWEKEARRMKQDKEMTKESFKGSSSSSNDQRYLNLKLSGSLFRTTDKEESVSGNSGKSISLFGSHCPSQPTSNKQMSRDNNIATDEINGSKRLRVSTKTRVSSNGSLRGLVLDDHQDIGTSGDSNFLSKDHYPTNSKQISRANNVSANRINGSKQLEGSTKTEVSNNGLSRGAVSDDNQDTGHMGPNVTRRDQANENRVASCEETHVVSQEDIPKQLARIYDQVLVVDNISVAKEVVLMLTTQYKHLVHACDTEVSNIDVKQETPVDHGEITCFSIYSGEDADFGNGKSCIWVDVLDGGGRDLLKEFAPFFEDQSIKKVWHNYSFDNHVIKNYGLEVSGFHADTMHMARLWDSSRRTTGGYSLEALTDDRNVMHRTKWRKEEKELIGKTSMKTIFG